MRCRLSIEDKHILMTMLHQFKVRDDLLPGKINGPSKAIVNKHRCVLK